MKENKGHQGGPDELRRRAVQKALTLHREPDAGELAMPPEKRRLVQELQVHQIELELQNDELQRAREETEQALARYTDLYEFAPVGYLTLDRGGLIQQVNLSGARLVGVERGRLVGMRLSVLISAESRRPFEALFAKVFESRTKQSCEVVMRWGEKEPVTVEIVAQVSEDGQACRIIAADISERKRAQEILSIHLQLQQFALVHSRAELLRRVLDEIERMTGGGVGVCYSLADDQRVLVREAWSTSTQGKLQGVQADVQRCALADAGVWADCVSQRRSVVYNDNAWPSEKMGLPELRIHVLRVLVVPILRVGQVVALVGVANKATDFTQDDVKTVDYLADVAWEIAEHKKAADERRDLQLQLQLAESQKMEAIGTLAGGIAHDFNNILAGLLGGLTLLDIELQPTNENHGFIQDMMDLVTRGSDLTRQLLGFARRGKYDVRPLDLARVVAKTSAMFGRTRKEVSIHLDFPPGLMAVLMDHTQIEQVLLNLFLNAAQAMPHGGTLEVRAENADLSDSTTRPSALGPGPFVKLAVQDTGVGMDAATQARIFEPFFTTKEPGKGTGLGLASVYGIVRSHGGFITVDSALGKGTTFSVYLPGTDLPTSEEKTPAAVIERGVGTILVVDDEPHILDVLTRVLKKIGYEVLAASGGRQAVEMVRQHGASISLVILDMIMPEMSGSQTYDALREVMPNVKVLVSSGYSIDEQAREMLARGCKGFIKKPFDIATLSSKLRALSQQQG